MGPRRRGSDSDPTSHIGILDDAEERPATKSKAKKSTADDALDLDGVW